MADEEEGLRVVLSPVQLVAVLQGGNIGAHEILMNRLWGGAKIIGGALELVGAGALLLTPEPTLLTKAGGGILGVHGSDTFGTGIRQVWTGAPTETLTQQAGEWAASSMGANKTQAARAGVILDVAVPLFVAGVTAAVRIVSVRSGRIVLAEEEAIGGHTILKHIGKTEPELRTRLAAEPALPAASSFTSLRVAEDVISDAMRLEAPAIRAWARAATPYGKYEFEHIASRNIGYGVLRKTGTLQQMRRVRIVLRSTRVSSKLYFVLTAFPIP